MTTKHDYYEVLGVPRDASDEDIRKAFRKKAMEYHPDRNKAEGTVDRFKEVNEAYQVLSDSQKRQQYDHFGHQGLGAASGSGRGFDGFETFGGFGDIFDAFFGGGTRTRHAPREGADLRIGLTMDFEEAVFGTAKEVEVERVELCGQCRGTRSAPGTKPEQCLACRGTGEIRRSQQSIFGQFVHVTPCSTCGGRKERITSPCQECSGAGRGHRRRKINVTIPAGVEDGTQVRLTGEGEAGINGGRSGDLYIALRVRPHKLFRREGSDILIDLPINVAQAALGDVVSVPTLEGDTDLNVPPGIQSGIVLRLKGMGVAHLNKGRRGDQLVSVHVVTPRHLTEEQRRLFQELAESLDMNGQDSDGSKGLFDRFKDVLGGERRE